MVVDSVSIALERLGMQSVQDSETVPPNKKIFCFSDTHIGLEEVSANETQLKTIREGIESSDEAWLLGDIFELTFLKRESREDLLERAKRQLEIWDDYGMQESYKHNCTKHIVWGDHEKPIGDKVSADMLEWTARFRSEITKHIREKNLNYIVHEEDYIQDGDVVGTHGHLGFTENTFVPPDWGRDIWVSIIQSINGDVAEKLVNRNKWSGKVLDWLQSNTNIELLKVRSFVTGHLHSPHFGETHRSKKWYNTGSTVWRKKDLFQPITFELEYGKDRTHNWFGHAINFEVFEGAKRITRRNESSPSTFISR